VKTLWNPRGFIERRTRGELRRGKPSCRKKAEKDQETETGNGNQYGGREDIFWGIRKEGASFKGGGQGAFEPHDLVMARGERLL